MKLFTYMGAIACMGLFFFTLDTLELSIIFFALAAMGYIGGVAMNNSYLPVIATVDQQDEVSAKGFAYGYVGCVTLQLICFVLIFKKEWFGITDSALPARISFFLVGLWWLGFSQIPFRALPPNVATVAPGLSLIGRVRREFESVRQRIKGIESIKRFLPAFFFSAIGVQTIMIVASAFGEKVLHLGTTKLIATIICIQLVAILGAHLMSILTRRFGNIAVLLVVILLWGSICVAAYFLNTELQFYILAFMVGLLMGGIQSLSRSTYSKLLPEDLDDTTAFFSFYDVTEKLAIVVGLFSFGFIEQMTHNIRFSALFLSIFFVLSLLLMLRMMKFNNGLKS
jgi:UMF1 family MFS transporter